MNNQIPISSEALPGAFFLLLQDKLSLMGALGLLIFLDCFTRWAAISHGREKRRGEAGGFLAAVRGIPAARREGLIRSSLMRRRGVEKLLLYGVLLLTAAAVDAICGRPELSPLVEAYLSMTEALSIVENLSGAGVENVERLLEKLRRR